MACKDLLHERRTLFIKLNLHNKNINNIQRFSIIIKIILVVYGSNADNSFKIHHINTEYSEKTECWN